MSQKAIAARLERLRNRQIKKYRPLILKALNDWFRKVADNPSKKTINSLSEKDMLKVFSLIYLEGTQPFARDVWKSLMGKAENDFPETEFLAEMERLLAIQGAVNVKGITVTTKEQLRRILARGVEDGLGIAEIAREIRDAMEFNLNRATMIARTEIIGTANAASFESAKLTNLKLKKKWLWSGKSRESHASVNGTTKAMDKFWIVQGKPMAYPHDPSGGPENIINCGCTLTYVTQL